MVGSWTELGRIQGPDNDADLLPYSFDISSYASPDTMVRLATSDAMDGNTRIWFDNVQVEYTSDVVSTEVVEYVQDTFDVQVLRQQRRNLRLEQATGSSSATTDMRTAVMCSVQTSRACSDSR